MPYSPLRKAILLLLLMTATACAATETKIDWLDDSQKIDMERNHTATPAAKPAS